MSSIKMNTGRSKRNDFASAPLVFDLDRRFDAPGADKKYKQINADEISRNERNCDVLCGLCNMCS